MPSGFGILATLKGRITSGGVGVPNATVVVDMGGGQTLRAPTLPDGHYLIMLPAGTYDVSVEYLGTLYFPIVVDLAEAAIVTRNWNENGPC